MSFAHPLNQARAFYHIVAVVAGISLAHRLCEYSGTCSFQGLRSGHDAEQGWDRKPDHHAEGRDRSHRQTVRENHDAEVWCVVVLLLSMSHVQER